MMTFYIFATPYKVLLMKNLTTKNGSDDLIKKKKKDLPFICKVKNLILIRFLK